MMTSDLYEINVNVDWVNNLKNIPSKNLYFCMLVKFTKPKMQLLYEF